MTLLLLLLSLAGGAGQDPSSSLLDLTKVAPEVLSPGTHRGWGDGLVGYEGQRPRELPLTIVLRGLDATYEIGSPVVYELVLRNTSQQDVTIPWSGDWRLRPDTHEEASRQGYSDALMSLKVLDKVGHSHFVAGETIHCIRSKPETQKTIHPGESVTIRAKSRMGLQSKEETDRIVPASGADVDLVAEFRLLRYEMKTSNNRISVKLTRRSP